MGEKQEMWSLKNWPLKKVPKNHDKLPDEFDVVDQLNSKEKKPINDIDGTRGYHVRKKPASE
jgi:hypothetical protein